MKKIIAFIAYVVFGGVFVHAAYAKKTATTKRIAVWVHNHDGNCKYLQIAIAQIAQNHLKASLMVLSLTNGAKTSTDRSERRKQEAIIKSYAKAKGYEYLLDVACTEYTHHDDLSFYYFITLHRLKNKGFYRGASGYTHGDRNSFENLKFYTGRVLAHLKPGYLKEKPSHNNSELCRILSRMQKSPNAKISSTQPKKRASAKNGIYLGLGGGFTLFGSGRSSFLNSYLGCGIGIARFSNQSVGIELSFCGGKSNALEWAGDDLLIGAEVTFSPIRIDGEFLRLELTFSTGFRSYMGGIRNIAYVTHLGLFASIALELTVKPITKIGLKAGWVPGSIDIWNKPPASADLSRYALSLYIVFGK